jgi:hypothetical protein
MDEPLNPISFEFFHRFLLYQATFNISLTLQLETILEPALCESALRLVMQRHPILRSRVAIDLQSPDRYFWHQLPISSPLPLTWCQLEASAADLSATFSTLERNHQNCCLRLDRSVPFHLFIVPWQQQLTYLQLVASHTALDGKSLLLFQRDFLRFYSALQQGKSPQVTPTALGGDWSRLFAIKTDSRAKENLDRDILADQQTPPHLNDSHQSSGWPHLKAALARANHQGPTGLALIPFPRPRLACGTEELLAAGLSGTVKTLAHRMSKAHTAALRQYLAEKCLKVHDRSTRASLNSLFSAIYLQCQLTLARQAGESVAIVNLGMAIDLRSLCADKELRDSIQDLFYPVVMTIDVDDENSMDLVKLMNAIDQKKIQLLTAIPRHSLEKVWSKYRLGERVTSDRWLDFLAATSQIFHPQSAKVLRVSYMGAIDKYFSELFPFKLHKAKINTTNAGFPVPSLLIYQFEHQLNLSLSYVDPHTDTDQLYQLWHLLIQALASLSSPGATYPRTEDA